MTTTRTAKPGDVDVGVEHGPRLAADHADLDAAHRLDRPARQHRVSVAAAVVDERGPGHGGHPGRLGQILRLVVAVLDVIARIDLLEADDVGVELAG